MIFHSFKVGETDHVNTDPLWICDCSMCFPNCRMGTNQNTNLISNMKGIQSHHIGAQLGTRDDTCCIELFDEFPCLFGRLWYQTWGHSIRSIASEHPLGVWYTVPLFSTACILELKIKYKSPPKQNPACTLSFWSHTLSELLDHVDLLLESQLNFLLRAVARIQPHPRVQAKQTGKGWNMCASCSFWDMSCKKFTNKVKSLKHTTKHSSSNISNRVNNFYIQFLECHKSLKLAVKETGANFHVQRWECLFHDTTNNVQRAGCIWFGYWVGATQSSSWSWIMTSTHSSEVFFRQAFLTASISALKKVSSITAGWRRGWMIPPTDRH